MYHRALPEMVALLVVACLLSAQPKYPLATVFVRDGRLSISELGSAIEKPLPTPGLIVESASLSFSKTRVAFTATRKGDPNARLFVLVLKTGETRELPTLLAGGHRDAVWSSDEKFIYFTAANDATSGPAHPTRLRRWNIFEGKADEVAPEFDTGVCEFHPAPRANDVVHVGTTCFGRFAMAAAPNPDAGTSLWVPQRVGNPDIEIASSFDGSRLVYTARTSDGLSLFVKTGSEPARLAITLPADTRNVQPKFVCPRDVMFLREGVPWVLNTTTLTAEAAANHK